MSVRQSLLAAATVSILALAPASAQTLRYANQGELKSLDVEAAQRAVAEHVGKPLKLATDDAAAAIVRVADARMAGAIRLVSIERGHDPLRLAGILWLLRPVVDEILVAVDDRNESLARVLAEVADRLVLFPHRAPGDRPIPWLFGLCRSDWIFNIDDDEVPSAALLGELPSLLQLPELTHCWIARRWPGRIRDAD